MPETLDALSRRHALDPTDLDAALSLTNALIRRGDAQAASPVLRAALRASTTTHDDTARRPLLAKLPAIPSTPPTTWRRLCSWLLPDGDSITALCVTEPARGGDAVDADAEVRVDLVLSRAALATIDLAHSALEDIVPQDERLREVFAVHSHAAAGLVATLTRGGSASLWHRSSGRLVRRVERVESMRFATRRDTPVWLLGERSGAVRRVDIEVGPNHVEALDRSPWLPSDTPAAPIWDLAWETQSDVVTLLDPRGVRRYRRMGHSERLDPDTLLSTGGAHARISSDGRRAVALTPERGGEARWHQLRVSDLSGEGSGERVCAARVWAAGWRGDVALERAALWDVSGRVALFDLGSGERLADWSAGEGLLEVWPDGADRFAWMVFADRLELWG